MSCWHKLELEAFALRVTSLQGLGSKEPTTALELLKSWQ